jgi:hypothetical protein
MAQLSLLTKISFIGTVVFGLLWFITSKERVYETIEFEVVSLKKVFLILAVVCLGFCLASLFMW